MLIAGANGKINAFNAEKRRISWNSKEERADILARNTDKKVERKTRGGARGWKLAQPS